ncbi:MAG: cobyrinate a,c-diamide synthase, partial [Clostridia bacterium]
MKNRILIGGVASGCGKTTITLGILKALQNRGIDVTSFKCGCDYIDLMFHKEALGIDGGNLDSFFYDDDTIKAIFDKNSGQMSVIEGVMGFYDGEKASAYDIAKLLNCPVILVINAKGTYTSTLPVIKGFLEWKENNNIKAVILNNIKKDTFLQLKPQIEQLGVTAIGGFPKLPNELIFDSRHLGLVTASEIANIKVKIEKLAQLAEENLDIDKIIQLSSDVEELKYTKKTPQRRGEITIAVAKDNAFCFLYRENIEILEKLGAKIRYFSPLNDEHLPPCDGIYLVGGYPELHLESLEKNVSMRNDIKKAVENGVPTIAECGGFMYLCESIDGRQMVGKVAGKCVKTDSLKRFGYLEMTAKCDNLLLEKGDSIRAHEFHYYESDRVGDSFVGKFLNGNETSCGICSDTMYAGFPHIAFYSNEKSAER